MKQRLSILLIVLVIFTACVFSPDGEHFVELDPTGTPPAVEVELNFDTDTLYINNNDWIMFSYKKDGDKVNWARFIIDGQETSPNDEQQGGVELYFYFPGFEPGTHSLSMQLYTQSGTGSIADKTGAEGFLFQKDWVLIIVDDSKISPNVVDTTFENGLLMLHWEKYKGLNFENYKVYKYVQPTALPDQLVATVTNQHQTSVIDPNYHGENSIYYVRVNERYRGSSIQIEGPLPALSATNNAEGNIVLHWEKPSFWSALKGYRILDDDISWTSSGFVPLYVIDNPQVDSFVIADEWFGFKRDFWLQMDPSGTSYVENWIRPVQLASQVQASYGQQSPQFLWAQTGTENKIYLLGYAGYDGLSIINTETLERKFPDNVPDLFRIYVSSNNKYLVGRERNSNNVFLFDMSHPENNKTIDIDSQFSDFGHLVSVSDKGTGIILSGQTAVLYNFVDEQVLAEQPLNYNGLHKNHISGDGNYFALETDGGYSWYSCENNTITELENIKQAENGIRFTDFIPGEQTHVVVATYDHASVYNCKTQELLFRSEFESGVETSVCHVVKSSGELFILEGENMVLLDLENDKRTFLGKTKEDSWWELVYNNGQILWNEGRRLDVSDKL